jgi:1-acyl-sn-glycerol-3-phosphate acyltransferase
MNQRAPRRSWLWIFAQVVSRIGTTVLFDLKTFGRENIPARGGALLLANHQSYLDPVLVAVQLRRPVSFMAKSELFEQSRFLAWLIRSLHAFPVKRRTADVGAMKEALARLSEGNILNMYPEGTRTETGEIGPLLPGIALVVKRAGVPVIPVVIDGSYHAWGKGSKGVRRHPVRILYGRPLRLEGLRGNEVLPLIDRTLRSMLSELREKSKQLDDQSGCGPT